MCYKTLLVSVLLSILVSFIMKDREVIISPQIFNGPVHDGSEYGENYEKDIFAKFPEEKFPQQ